MSEGLPETIARAEKSFSAKDYKAALSLLEPIREVSPVHRRALILKAKALGELGDKSGAGEIYSSLFEFDANDREARGGYIWTLHGVGKYAEAVELWAEVRQRWPDHDSGYFGGGGALMTLKRFDEAEALLLEGISLFPDAVNLYESYARCAMRRNAWHEALHRWTTVRGLKPTQLSAYVEAATCNAELGRFNQANQILDNAPAQVKSDIRWLSSRAQLAVKLHDLFKALALWDDVATAFPGSAEGYVGAADVLQKLGRYEDAENVLGPALRMFPDLFDVARRHAWLAHYRADWDEADKRWRRLREKFPTRPLGYSGAITTLSSSGRPDEAEALASEAMQKFPSDFGVLSERAHIANKRQKWDLMAERFRDISVRFPHEEGGYRCCSDALIAGKRFEEAEGIVQTWREKLGNSPNLARTYATIASKKADWATAEQRWSEAVKTFPQALELRVGLASVLCPVGKFEESKKVLTAAAEMFPGNLEVELAYAETLSFEQDWEQALPLWAELQRKYSSHPGIKKSLNGALWQARQDLALLPPEDRFEIPAILLKPNEEREENTAELHDLFMKFESIGDTCEFGIAQRRFGADPLSLLRWAHTRPEDLITALDDQLRGIGDPEFTSLVVKTGEYVTQDSRYLMGSHTFTRDTAVPYDKFYAHQCKRLQYLRDKLLDDLANPDKLFIYKSNYGLTDEQARNVHAALRRHGGGAWLLCMRLADKNHAVGDLEELGDGLFMGYADRFSTVDINVPNWVSVCKRVAARWDEERDALNNAS